jgi:hypothetical protein
MGAQDVAVIPCAGSGERWANYRDVPKPLVCIEGQTLLQRAVQLLHRERPGVRIYVVGTDPRLAVDGAELVEPDPRGLGCDFDKLTCKSSRWSSGGRTFILWGDVWWSDTAMSRICAPGQPPLAWYGRNGPSRITAKPYRELWGCSVLPEMRETLLGGCIDAAGMFHAGIIPRALAWFVYALMTQQDARFTLRMVPEFVEVDDWTEDFDFPRDLNRWLAARARRWCGGDTCVRNKPL